MLHFEMATKKAGEEDPLGVQAGRTLAEIAEKRGLKQNQVAAYAKLPASTIHNYFTGGTKKPSLTYLLRISEALDVTLAQVLGQSPMPEIKPIATVAADDRLARLEETVEQLRQALLEAGPRKSGSRPAQAKSGKADRRPGTGRRRRASGG